ncbi:MAG: acetyl-CoA C-acyltransferase [Candidatus Sericytochromatia bacterium]|nr:acetyl-CoA C-acyltransferase [Candidatus Sericytochromatia bacterium]
MSQNGSRGRTVIVSAVRTPFGKLSGAFASLTAVDLGSRVIAEAVRRAGIDGGVVDNVIMGQVLQAGAGQIPSRQAALRAGLSDSVHSLTINKVCASGMRAISLADQFQRVGDGEVFVAGGMESMTQAPYYLTKARGGYRMGNDTILDGMIHDGLWCAFRNVHMGVHGDNVSREFAITREEMDMWSARSHQRAAAAYDAGHFAEEVMTVEIPQGKKPPLQVSRDESLRPDTTEEGLAKLRPVFGGEGMVTAGNAPGINDGACALVLMSEAKAAELGLEPLAAVVGHGWVATEPPYLHTVPALALERAMVRTGIALDDLDRLEINEAFAAVTLTSTRILAGRKVPAGVGGGGSAEVDPAYLEALRARTNVNGGAVALGHPIGASGARIVTTLAYELVRSGGRYGAAAICSGSAQGDAIILENLRR